ncbi:LPS translocon maturation chaperone LptM [Roseateles chitinivorans]|uniref:LPS translocon maturation chaperone LptM n=1 Tax=Roseateles chitinivorans TaxID=2917965 RepID=UPI003D67F03A
MGSRKRAREGLDCEPMKNVKTRSVGAASTPTRRRAAKAMTTLMLCAAALAVSACGQKRPLQLPQGKHPAPASASTASSPASAASAAN